MNIEGEGRNFSLLLCRRVHNISLADFKKDCCYKFMTFALIGNALSQLLFVVF